MLKNARAIDKIIVNRDDPGGDYESPQTGTTAEEVMEYYLGAFIGGAYTCLLYTSDAADDYLTV